MDSTVSKKIAILSYLHIYKNNNNNNNKNFFLTVFRDVKEASIYSPKWRWLRVQPTTFYFKLYQRIYRREYTQNRSKTEIIFQTFSSTSLLKLIKKKHTHNNVVSKFESKQVKRTSQKMKPSFKTHQHHTTTLQFQLTDIKYPKTCIYFFLPTPSHPLKHWTKKFRSIDINILPINKIQENISCMYSFTMASKLEEQHLNRYKINFEMLLQIKTLQGLFKSSWTTMKGWYSRQRNGAFVPEWPTVIFLRIAHCWSFWKRQCLPRGA